MQLDGVVNKGIAPVPLPAAVWLLGSGLLGLMGLTSHQRRTKF
ncbi:MAG: PEP-CTERM sorting domain-containing protein [Acidiferrobacterales bacterium]